MVTISEARYAGGHSIWIRFSNGKEGIAELGDLVQRYPVAAELRDPEKFRMFLLDDWPTVVWPCGFDVSPELLYERATGKARHWQTQKDEKAA